MGTANIIAMEKIGEILIVNVTGSNNAEILYYKWELGGMNVGTNTKSYTGVASNVSKS